jgi:hypothetical protein
VDWRDKRLITKFYMDQNIKINWTKGRHWVWRLEAELDDDVVCLQYIQTVQRILTKNELERFGDFKERV